LYGRVGGWVIHMVLAWLMTAVVMVFAAEQKNGAKNCAMCS
jgi:hypothetical protein